ncbi:hypothetical protein AYI69_g2429 [Smittium culicis]|uniref:Uncharacterized protein n=1 Tax=Smittium culicis TaxID=133412 RepID=A0A1R1YMK6_9FUNG|nr:hypothetical protein AYI69_g2429 [Smittium culicis]
MVLNRTDMTSNSSSDKKHFEEYPLVVYQHQRYWPFYGWTNKKVQFDPYTFSDESGTLDYSGILIKRNAISPTSESVLNSQVYSIIYDESSDSMGWEYFDYLWKEMNVFSLNTVSTRKRKWSLVTKN